MKSYVVYAVTTIVIVVSTIFVVFLPVNSELKTMFSLPGIAGLFSLLVQGWRDQVAHEKTLELQKRQHEFDLAIASHMANVVFDKQVEFCEKYSKKLHAIVKQMFQDGPSEKTMGYANELTEVRVEYSSWISKELTEKIKPFEAALREIAALNFLEKNYANDPNRHATIDKMFNIYTKFLGHSMEGLPREPETAADKVLEYFTEILNVFDLEILRRSAIRLAREKYVG
ncbi:MAG: hypothetical protein U0V02_18140 [Anaerolineales bacterium]